MQVHAAISLFICMATAMVYAGPVTEDAKILPQDGDSNDEFGRRIAIQGNYAIVGAPGDEPNGAASGSAYILDLTTNELISKLMPLDGSALDMFGDAVDVFANYAVVGAPDDIVVGPASGSAYIFNILTGAQLHKIVPTDASANDRFGQSVGIFGDVIVVGASGESDLGDSAGAAYIFDVQEGVQLAKITASDGQAQDQFGNSVDINGEYIAVGAHLDIVSDGDQQGSVYLFDVQTYLEAEKIVATDGEDNDQFGRPVALSSTHILIGARLNDSNGRNSGAAYLYKLNGLDLVAKLTSPVSAIEHVFGTSVAISDDYAAVGAPLADYAGEASGAAFLFSSRNGELLAQLTPSDLTAVDWFGSSVAISDRDALAGSRFDDDLGSASGSVYIFDSSVFDCPADLSGDGELDFFDVSGFLAFYQLGNLTADFTGDGTLDFFDVSAFLNAFNAGCP